jgi:3-hydroxybutyryl-CoA dehydratase
MTVPPTYYFEDLKEGMTETYTRVISDNDLHLFADCTGDYNPVHFDDAYAAGTRFKGRICHGMLVASLISTALGTKMPGPGTVYVSQSLRFKAPVRPGDEVVARVTVTKLIPEKRFVEFETSCSVGGKVVLEGDATGLIPSRAA